VKPRAEDAVLISEGHLDAGRKRLAFETLWRAAREGDSSAALNLGYFYDKGIGTRKDAKQAYRWYAIAYRRGDASGANNVGVLLVERGEHDRALRWFRRAVDAGDDGSNLQIAKLYLSRQRPDQALRHLEAVLRSNQVCEDDHEQAARLLQGLRKPKPARGKAR
jgi:TPR repeat protein